MANLEERQRIGKIIHAARKNKKITQMQLGQMLSVTKKAISDYELAKTSVIPFEKRVKLARILEISLADLLYSDERIPFSPQTMDAITLAFPHGEQEGEEGKIDEILESLTIREVAKFSDYFCSLSKKYELSQLLYILFVAMKNSGVWFDAAEQIIANVLKYRFCVFGMQSDKAVIEANQLASLILYYYLDYKNDEDGEFNINNYLYINTQDETWKSDLYKAIEQFKI